MHEYNTSGNEANFKNKDENMISLRLEHVRGRN